MSDSSPASIRSQAHEQGFKSQVPFYTQVPHQHASSTAEELQTGTSPSSRDGTPAIASETFSNAKVGHTKAQSSHASAGQGKDTNNERQIHTGHIEDSDKRNLPTSSVASIQCEPLETISENLAMMSSSRTQTIPPSRTAAEPFPLVQWIRRIREETPRQWPTSPLRWSRSVPKRQRTILEADEACFPPLPGKPVRQGTVPIDILTELIRWTDEKVQADKVERPISATPTSDRLPEQAMSKQETAQQIPQQPTSATPSQNVDDSEEEHWSPSPPSQRRRLLPQDTSPIRPLSRSRPEAPPAEPEAFGESNLNDKDKLARAQTTDGKRSSAHQRNLPVQPMQSEESEIEEHSNSDREPRQISRQAENHVEATNASLARPIPVTQRVMSPGLVNQSKSRIQVKDTPYPFKDMPHSHRHSGIMEDAPQSSLVVGTYPEASRHTHVSDQLSRNDLPSSPPDVPVEASPSLHEDDAHTAVSHPPRSSSGPRLMQHMEIDNSELSAIPTHTPSGNDKHKDHFIATIQSRKRVHVPYKVLSVGRSLSRRREPSTSPDSLAEQKFAFNERRKAASRLFRKSIAARVNDNVDSRSPGTQPAYAVNATGKRVSSSPISNYHDVPSVRSSVETSVTDHSIHSLTGGKDSTSVPKTLRVMPVDTLSGPQALFRNFQDKYPHYRGSFKAFQSTLQLLASLRMAPHEPHPSLWDDFVYRMAHEYKVYLQKCIDQDESAVSYPDYYFLHVDKPKCHQVIVTKTTLNAALEEPARGENSTLSSIRRSESMAHDERTIVKVDAQTRPIQYVQPRTIQTPAHTIQETQESPELPRTLGITNPSVRVHQSETAGNEFVHSVRGKTLSKKRRSLPWTSDDIELSTSSPATRQHADITTSNKRPSVKSTVERWLDRPAGASSPELMPVSIPLQVEEHREKTTSGSVSVLSSVNRPANSVRNQDLDVSNLQLPTYLITSPHHREQHDEDATPVDQGSVASSIIATQDERPVTPFTLFARNFAKLQAEKNFHATSSARRKLPINVYNW